MQARQRTKLHLSVNVTVVCAEVRRVAQQQPGATGATWQAVWLQQTSGLVNRTLTGTYGFLLGTKLLGLGRRNRKGGVGVPVFDRLS